MKFERSRNSIRNIIFGSLSGFVSAMGPFAVRTALIYVLGIEYLGLNSLFTSLLSFLSLSELGIGTALVYAMYSPIATEDDDSICALLNVYKKLYKYIGLIILGIGLLLLPFLKYLIKDYYPNEINLYLLYIIYLFNTVIGYLLFAYKQSLLSAHQRQDVISKINMIFQFIMYLVQIIILLLFKNYYLFIIVMPICTILSNYANKLVVDRMYPQYTCKGNISAETENEIKKNVYALIGTKMSAIVLHASDTVVISSFIGLGMVGIYENYFYIINVVSGFVGVLYSSMTAGIGNSIIIENDEKNYNDYRIIYSINAWIISFFSVGYLCLIQPFVKIWLGNDFLLGESMIVLFTIYIYFYHINKVNLTYKDAAGLWWQDRFRPYVIMLVNIVLNVIMINIIGIIGVILSTIFSLCISFPWASYIVFKYIFKKNCIEYIGTFVKRIFLDFLCIFFTWLFVIRIKMDGIIGLIVKLAVCTIIFNFLYIVINYRNKYLKKGYEKLKSVIRL